jgi:hypothetical protein
LKSRLAKWQNPQFQPKLATSAALISPTALTGAQDAAQPKLPPAGDAEPFTKKPLADAPNAAP